MSIFLSYPTTQAYMTYDERALYLKAQCYDPDIRRAKARWAGRNALPWSDWSNEKMTGYPSWEGTKVIAKRRLYRGALTIFINGTSKGLRNSYSQPRGALTIFINGRLIHGGAVLFRKAPRGYPSFGKAEPEIVMFSCVPFQVGPEGAFDLGPIAAMFEKVFTRHPKALGACMMSMQPAPEWIARHPDETTTYDRPVDWDKVAVRDPSWASPVWREDSARYAEAIARHPHTRFQGRVMLSQIGAGQCGENGPAVDPFLAGNWFCGDFSLAMAAYFRRKLREYYAEDEERLRRAWSDSDVTFETARPPDRIKRLQMEWFRLRSPARRRTADYCWAGAAKRGASRESLTASPLGAVLDCDLHAFMIHHLMKESFEKATASPDLDMFESPASYALRDPGRGDTSSMIPLGMLRLASKMWLRDFDTRTRLVANAHEEHPVGSLWRSPESPWRDIRILLRDTGYSLLKGGALWWHEINDGMYSLPEHIETVKCFQSVGRGVVHADRSTPPGMGIFLDNRAGFHQPASNRLICPMHYEVRRLHWTHCGMACEVCHVEDASHPDMPAHRVLMVTNAFTLSDRQTQSLIVLVRKRRAALIWLGAPGVVNLDTTAFDLDRASRIAGFRLRAANMEALPRISLIPSSHPWSRPPSADGGTLSCFGTGPHDFDDAGTRAVGPLFYAEGPGSDITVLGLLDALQEPGLIVRRMDGYTRLFCSAPYLPNALLRAIGKTADNISISTPTT
ncbi:MAG: hypothetical protein IT210_14800 [Armatimonadetes bacterium]|nr:hypothetical protein [Armatimonadota bacterium]